MPDVERQLRDYWSEITVDLPEPSLEAARQERVGDGAVRPLQERLASRHRPAWVVAVAAFGGVLLLGGVVWLLAGGGDPAPVIDQRPEDTMSTTARTATTAASAVTIVPTEWNPILADTRARQAPPAATCAPGTDPGRSGPADQERPETITHAGLTAVFDRRAGRIVYVDAAGTTWTFDVCANTWQEMDPVGTPYEYQGDLFDAAGEPTGAIGDMVYDVDSDRTVVFSIVFDRPSAYVYDANTNSWTADPLHGLPDNAYPFGAVYDPVSGLIITTTMADGDRWEVWSYDVDTSSWTPVGTIAPDRVPPCCTQIDLLGYAPELDRLILTTYGEVRDESPSVIEQELTLLLDPRTGTIEVLATPSPIVDLGWPSHSYGQAGGTVFVNQWTAGSTGGSGWGRVCGFDTGTLEWTRCFDAPPARPARSYSGYAAMVDDPINGRLVFINGRYGDFWSVIDAAVWAIDLRSADTLTLVPLVDGP